MGRRSALPLACWLVVLGLIVPACRSAPLPRGVFRVTTATGQAVLRVEVAADHPSRSRGLMDRRHLDPDAGMAFVFQGRSRGGFWMKDTLIPLSIAFWDGSSRIVSILDMTPCERDPCPIYFPSAFYTGAVEANLGWFSSHGVRVGDRVILTRD